MTLVRYNGQYYQRGWILGSDMTHVHQGRPFNFYPAPVRDPQVETLRHRGFVKLTLPLESYLQARGFTTWPAAYFYWVFPNGHYLVLDQHTWEDYPG